VHLDAWQRLAGEFQAVWQLVYQHDIGRATVQRALSSQYAHWRPKGGSGCTGVCVAMSQLLVRAGAPGAEEVLDAIDGGTY
jgi:hypothetical protein